MIVFVKQASVIRTGLARVELAIHGSSNVDARRTLAAAAYRVAARLEEIAGAEGFAYSVSAAKARLGIVELSYTLGGMDGDGMADDIADELVIDACGENDLYPIDVLVENGDVDPAAEG